MKIVFLLNLQRSMISKTLLFLLLSVISFNISASEDPFLMVTYENRDYMIQDDEAYYSDFQFGIPESIKVYDKVYPVVGLFQKYCFPNYALTWTYWGEPDWFILEKDGVIYIPKNITKAILAYYETGTVHGHKGYIYDHTVEMSIIDYLRMKIFRVNYCDGYDFEVEEGNSIISSFDGVVYNADGTEMIIIPTLKTTIKCAPTTKKIAGNVLEMSVIRNVSSITLSKSLEEIEDNAFNECPLDTIISYATTPPLAQRNSFSSYETTKLIVPDEAVEAYRTTSPWKYFSHIISMSASGIEDVGADADDRNAEVYSLSGLRMTDCENLPAGIYIRRSGSKTRKIVVK